MQAPGLYIATGDHGRGVYTALPISAGSVVEIAHVIPINVAQTPIIHKTVLHDYYFAWGADGLASAIATGYGSLYNHDGAACLDFEPSYEELTITFVAMRDISAGEELTIDYHAGLTEGTLWF